MSRSRDGDRGTREWLLWQHEQSLALSGDLKIIPVSFLIPENASPTTASANKHGIVWRLDVQIRVLGCSYAEQFEIPVLQIPVPQSQKDAIARIAIQETTSMAQFEMPPDLGIRVGLTTRGATEFYFGACRNPGMGISWAVFSLFCMLPVLFAIGKFNKEGWNLILGPHGLEHLPLLIFLVVFSAFALLLGFTAVSSLLMSRRVEVDSERVTIITKLLGGSWRRVIPRSWVDTVEVQQSATHGGQAFYSIMLVGAGGENRAKKFCAGSEVAGSETADWIAGQMRQALGINGD